MTKEQKVVEQLKCRDSYRHFIENHVKTYDGETGKVEGFAEFKERWDKPEYKEDVFKLIDKIHVKVTAKRKITKPDLLLEKSRQMYCTWAIVAYIVWLILFMPNIRVLITSEKEDKIDKRGDYNTHLGKIDFIIEHLPDYLQPDKSDILRSHMKIAVLSINSQVIGDAGLNPGRGEQYDLIFNDEFAHQEFTHSKLAAEREACKGCNIQTSTPKGKNNAFYDTRDYAVKQPEKSSYEVLTYHWILRRSREWYETKVRDYNGDDAMVAQELDISYEGSLQGRCFKQFKSNLHIAEYYPHMFTPSACLIGLDFGFAHPTACVFICKSGDKYIVFDEYVMNELPVDKHVENINGIITRWNLNPKDAVFFGDPSGASRSRETGVSSYDLFARCGVSISQADNRVMEGITRINEVFYKDMIYINRKCSNLIDALNEAVYPTNRNGEITGEKYKEEWYTDVLDAFRYGIMEADKWFARRLPNKPRVLRGIGMGV